MNWSTKIVEVLAALKQLRELGEELFWEPGWGMGVGSLVEE